MRVLIAACFLLSACATVPPHIERDKLDTMVVDIIQWLAANSQYPVVPPPNIKFTDTLPLELQRLGKETGIEEINAGYLYGTRTVYLPTSLRLDIEYDVSMLAHELVHHLQISSGFGPQDREEFEKEAVILSYDASLYICRPDGVERGDGFSPGSC